MPQYQVDALRTVRVIQAQHERAGHDKQAEQMRKIGDQVEKMAEEIAALKGTVQMLMGCIEDTKRYPDMHDDFVEELEAAQAVLARLQGDK